MASGAGAAGGEVDWLTAGPPPGPPRRPRRRLVVGVVVVAVAAAVIGPGLVARSGADDAPESAPTPGAVRTSTRPARSPSPTPASGPVVVRRSGPLVPGLGADWEVYARTDDTVYRIEVGTGRVTATRHESFGSSGPVTFVADARGVILRPMDEGAGVAVPDGRPAQPLTGLLAKGGYTLPGPPGQVWVDTSAVPGGDTTAMRLVRFAGTATGTDVTTETGYFSGDGAGGLLLGDVGGVWEVRPAGLRRLTTGGVAAVGSHHYLLVRCDARHVCDSWLYDRQRRTERPLSIPYPGRWVDGVISPDGRFVAFTRYETDGSGTRLEIFDLQTSRILLRVTGPDPGTGQAGSLWSPDGRWLATLLDGRLALIDLRTGRRVDPELDLPLLQQLTGRSRS